MAGMTGAKAWPISHPGLWTEPATYGVRLMTDQADVAQLAERVLGKDEVTSSILVIGSSDKTRMSAADS